jgi:hypothetical protein
MQDYGWVAEVQDRAYGRQNELIYGLLDFTGVLRIQLEFYESPRSLRVFLGVVFACLLLLTTSFLCPYAGPSYSIALTIGHFGGTSILSLHTSLDDIKLTLRQ